VGFIKQIHGDMHKMEDLLPHLCSFYTAHNPVGLCSAILMKVTSTNLHIFKNVTVQIPRILLIIESLLDVKRPEREADHSPPSSAEVKDARSYLLQNALMVMVLI
jgi:hypothetical protein